MCGGGCGHSCSPSHTHLCRPCPWGQGKGGLARRATCSPVNLGMACSFPRRSRLWGVEKVRSGCSVVSPAMVPGTGRAGTVVIGPSVLFLGAPAPHPSPRLFGLRVIQSIQNEETDACARSREPINAPLPTLRAMPVARDHRGDTGHSHASPAQPPLAPTGSASHPPWCPPVLLATLAGPTLVPCQSPTPVASSSPALGLTGWLEKPPGVWGVTCSAVCADA